MEIAESIYEGVVEPSYKKHTRADANRAGHIREKERRSRLVMDSPQEGWERWQAQKTTYRYPNGQIKNLSRPWPRKFFRIM